MMARLPRITAPGLLRALKRDGWEVERQRGSHMQLRHPSKPGQVTVAYHAHAVVKLWVLEHVLEQAGLTPDDLRRLL